MPKSGAHRRGKTSQARVVSMTPELRNALLRQREAFKAKFGREPGPDDPVFFDPDADTPVPISREQMEADLDEVFRKAGIDPAKAAPFKKMLR
jgi:site-specific recombinase XerD